MDWRNVDWRNTLVTTLKEHAELVNFYVQRKSKELMSRLDQQIRSNLSDISIDMYYFDGMASFYNSPELEQLMSDYSPYYGFEKRNFRVRHRPAWTMKQTIHRFISRRDFMEAVYGILNFFSCGRSGGFAHLYDAKFQPVWEHRYGCILVNNDECRWLLVQPAELNETLPKTWCLPQGRRHFFEEDPQDCARRKVAENVGLALGAHLFKAGQEFTIRRKNEGDVTFFVIRSKDVGVNLRRMGVMPYQCRPGYDPNMNPEVVGDCWVDVSKHFLNNYSDSAGANMPNPKLVSLGEMTSPLLRRTFVHPGARDLVLSTGATHQQHGDFITVMRQHFHMHVDK